MIPLLRFTIKHFTGQWRKIAVYVAASVTVMAMGVILPFITGRFIDTLINAEDTGFIFTFGITFVVLNITTLLLSYLGRFLYIKVQIESTFALSKSVIRHIHDAKYLRYSQTDAAYLNNRISQDAGALVSFTLNTTSAALINGLSLLATYVMMFAINHNRK